MTKEEYQMEMIKRISDPGDIILSKKEVAEIISFMCLHCGEKPIKIEYKKKSTRRFAAAAPIARIIRFYGDPGLGTLLHELSHIFIFNGKSSYGHNVIWRNNFYRIVQIFNDNYNKNIFLPGERKKFNRDIHTEDFVTNFNNFGISSDLVGKHINEKYILVGAVPRNRKYPIILFNDNKKQLVKTSVDYVKKIIADELEKTIILKIKGEQSC
jgi:hypothetical protein